MSETERRPVEELQTVTDCVEEVIFAFLDAWVEIKDRTPGEVSQRRYDLYDDIEAIILRAQVIPRAATDNRHRSW